ncbi:avrbs3 family type III effector protein, partial [Ralstonia pseudosolanacearum]
QVVAIASHDGGKQALEAVGAQLVALRAAPYALSTEQVVAIASNHGGKQALEAVRALFRGLRAAPYGLSTAQVVAVASSNGGKQALEAVWALLPVLRATPYDLNTAQVVAIASHDGGKPALEAVWAKLPVLRGVPYELSTAQVVAIACISGQQALEVIEAHMPTLRQAPHSLSPERVAAIACIGGRSAVEAVRQGLPVKAIRRIRREKAPVAGPPPASLGPTPQELVAVLHFFRAHQQPRQAFVDALAAFQTTRPALLRLLSSVGVTEIEALGGTIPDATERWQRLLGRLGFRPATGAAAPSPDSLQGFAQSLERTLGSPGMAGQSACSPHRKRPAETAIAPRSIRRSPNNAGQPFEPWPDQLAWLQRRKRTARSHIRADSAASVPANLHLGTRAQFTPDRLRAEPGPIMQAHTSPASVSFGSHVAFEPGLPDPGTPTSADLASFEAEPFGVGPLDFHLDWLLQILEA